MKTIIFFLIIFCCSLSYISAQDIDGERDSIITNKIGYMAYPIGFYTPETEFAFGAGGLLYFRVSAEKKLRPSKIKLTGFYTSNNQYSIGLFPIIYFAGYDKYLFDSKFIFGKEIWKYYGIGNDTEEIEKPEYEQKMFRMYLELISRSTLFKGFLTGPIFDLTYVDIEDKRENELLNDENLTGLEGGITSGLGWSIVYDRRENIFYPSKNDYYKIRFTFYNKIFAGDFDYNRFVLDFRHYFDIINENIIALQFYYEGTNGDVPFYKLPQLGGDSRMRGYFFGRYRDKKYVAFQAEYRKIFWWRLGLTIFWGYGDVSSAIDKFHLPGFKTSYGFGLRFVFDKAEKMNVRMDIGFGANTNGIYFSLEEAF